MEGEEKISILKTTRFVPKKRQKANSKSKCKLVILTEVNTKHETLHSGCCFVTFL